MSKKLRTLQTVNLNGKIEIPKDSFIIVTDDMGVFLTRQQDSMGKKVAQKAVYTGTFSIDNLTKEHIDYTEYC